MNLFKVSSEISMENIDWFTTVETFSGIQSDYAQLFFFVTGCREKLSTEVCQHAFWLELTQ